VPKGFVRCMKSFKCLTTQLHVEYKLICVSPFALISDKSYLFYMCVQNHVYDVFMFFLLAPQSIIWVSYCHFNFPYSANSCPFVLGNHQILNPGSMQVFFFVGGVGAFEINMLPH